MSVAGRIDEVFMTFRYRLVRFGTDTLIYALLIGISLFMVLPFLWMLSTSFKPAEDIFAYPPILISAKSSLSSFLTLIDKYNIFRIVANTFLIAVGATALQLFFSSLGGYGFAKFKFPGQGALFAFLLGTLIIPFTIVMVPLYSMMRDLGWLNTYLPLIIPGAASAFGIFFMRQYISTLSDELLDAARIDGAGEFTIYCRIVVPVIAPGLTSLGMIFFMNAWNSFLWPLIVLTKQDSFTLPLIIRSMIGPDGRTVFNVQMAASIISIVPLLIVFLLFQRRFVEGITAGAVRG
jgi:ABC-type glycerol-3-phosphate transport system permease component